MTEPTQSETDVLDELERWRAEIHDFYSSATDSLQQVMQALANIPANFESPMTSSAPHPSSSPGHAAEQSPPAQPYRPTSAEAFDVTTPASHTPVSQAPSASPQAPLAAQAGGPPVSGGEAGALEDSQDRLANLKRRLAAKLAANHPNET